MSRGEMEDAEWEKLLVLLKRKCGRKNPTVTQIEWAMDRLYLPEDVEIDYDEIVLELSCFELDAEKEQIRTIEKKFARMEKQARALSGEGEMDFQTEIDGNRWREDNEALIERVEQLVG